MRFRIGFPIDGSKPETSRVVIVKMHKSKHHTIDDYDQPFYLAKESGADWLMKRLPANAQRDYRFHFTMIPPYSKGRVLNQFPYLGFSDSAACTLAFAQISSMCAEKPKIPLVLVSCTFKPHPLHLGLEKIKLDKVTQDDLQEAKRSLNNKYFAAKKHGAISLVLLENDAQILANTIDVSVIPLSAKVFVDIAKSDELSCPVVSCTSQQFLLLTHALNISSKQFSSGRSKKWWKVVAIIVCLIFLLLFPRQPTKNTHFASSKISQPVDKVLRLLYTVKMSGSPEGQSTILRQTNNKWIAVVNGEKLSNDDNYRIRVFSKQRSYVYIFQIDTNGELFWIHPRNKFFEHSLGENPLPKEHALQIPPEDAFYINDPLGVEHIYTVITPQRWLELERQLGQASNIKSQKVYRSFALQNRGIQIKENNDAVFHGLDGILVLEHWFYHINKSP